MLGGEFYFFKLPWGISLSKNFVSFRLLVSRVATVPIFYILLRHFSHVSLIAPINLLLGLPHFLFPGTILSTLLPTYSASFLRTCPNHLSPASHVSSRNRPTCAVPLMYSFLSLLTKIVTSSTISLSKNILRHSIVLGKGLVERKISSYANTSHHMK